MGQWSDGKKSGQGAMNYGDKSIYVGEWKDDKRHGEGKMTVRSKEGDYLYSGEW